MEEVSCGVCRSGDSAPVTVGKDYEYGTTADVFNIVECTNCENWYLNPRPVKEELSVIYPSNYYAYNYSETVHPLAIKAKNYLDKKKTRTWLKYVSAEKPVFLDVGCGDGRYLRMLNQSGVPADQLYGVEMDEKIIAKLSADGFKGFAGRIEDAEEALPKNSFDLIVSLQVLEHVEAPGEMLKAMRELLRPGGVLIIETPNTQSLDTRLFRKKYWGGYHFPRHWNLFNKRSLTLLATGSGLEIMEFNYLPAHSFWIYSLHHIVLDRFGSPGLAKFFDPFRNIPLLAFFTGWDILRAKLGFSTSNIQMIAKKAEI